MVTTPTTPQVATPEEQLLQAALTYLFRSKKTGDLHDLSLPEKKIRDGVRMLVSIRRLASVDLTMPWGGIRNGCWIPDNEERRPCCDRVRPTSRFKYRLFPHCCTAVHVANLYGVDRRELLKLSRDLLFLAEHFI